MQHVYMVERSILDAVCLSSFLLATKHLGLCTWWLGFCLGPHSSWEGGGQVCKESNTDRSVAVCSASGLLEQHPWLSGEQMWAHSVFTYVHICKGSTPVDTCTHIDTRYVFPRGGQLCEGAPNHQNTHWKSTFRQYCVTNSYSIGVTQGLKQPALHLKQYPRHLNTLEALADF